MAKCLVGADVSRYQVLLLNFMIRLSRLDLWFVVKRPCAYEDTLRAISQTKQNIIYLRPSNLTHHYLDIR